MIPYIHRQPNGALVETLMHNKKEMKPISQHCINSNLDFSILTPGIPPFKKKNLLAISNLKYELCLFSIIFPGHKVAK